MSFGVTLADLRAEVQRFMGYGRSTVFNTMSAAFQGDVTSIISRGMRQFYYPPVLPGETTAHKWSFLQERRALNFPAPVTTTATCTVTNGVATFNASVITSEYRHTMVKFTSEDGYYLAKTTVSGTQVQVWDTSLNIGTTTTATFWWNRCDFLNSGASVNVFYPPATNRGPLKQTNSALIMNMEQNEYVSPIGLPAVFAIEPMDWPDNLSNTAQTFHLRLYPWPQEKLTLYADVQLDIEAHSLLEAAGYPLGGTVHYETILTSCLAIAEEFGDTPSSKYRELFMQRLAASVMADRNQIYPSIFGYNGDASDMVGQRESRNVTVTYTP